MRRRFCERGMEGVRGGSTTGQARRRKDQREVRSEAEGKEVQCDA